MDVGSERGYREFGRDWALDALDGDGGLVVLGPSGCGRSSLLASVAAHEEGRRQLWWCRGRHVGEASGETSLTSVGAGSIGAVGPLLDAAASTATTVLVDDGHLLDDEILQRLVSLAERRGDLGLRMVAARRSGPVGGALARLESVLLGPGGALHLAPLSAAGVADWLADAGRDGVAGSDDVDGVDGLDGLARRTGGWPELVAAELAAPGVGVADLARARLGLLDPDHQRIVRAIAFGLAPGSAALVRAAECPHDDVDAALTAALAAGLVHGGAAPVPAIARALRSSAPAAERVRVAAAASASGPPDLIVGVARHLAALGDRSAEAGALFEQAGDILLTVPPTDAAGPAGLPAEAARFFEAAIRAGRPAGPLAARRAAAALASGRPEDAVALALRPPPGLAGSAPSPSGSPAAAAPNGAVAGAVGGSGVAVGLGGSVVAGGSGGSGAGGAAGGSAVAAVVGRSAGADVPAALDGAAGAAAVEGAGVLAEGGAGGGGVASGGVGSGGVGSGGGALAGFGAGSGPGRGEALALVAGAGWAHMGAPDLASESYLGAGGDAGILAVLPLLAAGRGDEARRILAEAEAPPAPGGQRGESALAEGAALWLAGESERAFELLERSAQLAQVQGGVEAWPDSPHAVLAAAAAQWLDAARAERVAQTAVERAVGGELFAIRHRLLLVWAALRGGRLDDARAALDAVPAAPQDMVRDTAVAAALAAAIALRTAGPEDLPQVHLRAARATCRSAPDPFAADLAGELAHLAARVGDDPEPILGPLERIAGKLGDPPTLAVPLAWARLMVAVAGDDAAAARRAAERVSAHARTSAETAETGGLAETSVPAGAGDRAARDAIALLADAAGAFADVLDGAVDADRVRAVAGRLTRNGMVFEASRLVGAASLRCDDAAATRTLLGELRRLRSTQVRAGGRRPKPAADLSEREREVARALLDGHTHREIGARLYISAKTVEHHVARIRQKLGATTTRADLLASIREELDRPVPARR